MKTKGRLSRLSVLVLVLLIVGMLPGAAIADPPPVVSGEVPWEGPTSLPEFAQPIPLITDDVQTTGQGLGPGGAGGGQETADQAALSQMAAAATATPLPTLTLTPSATPGLPAEQVANQPPGKGLR